jgi:hypothetical protein
MKFNKIVLISTVFILLMRFITYAQCGLYEISLNEKIDKSAVVIEGQVIHQNCIKGGKRNKIYTINTIKVLSVFKGKIAENVDVLTAGGKLNNQMEIASSLLNLNIGQTGMFFLYPESEAFDISNKFYSVYASAQGFYNYNLNGYLLQDVFNTYSNLNNEFYLKLKNDFGLEKIKDYEIINWGGGEANNRLTIINNFAPLSVNAGVGEQITINGFGFGNSRNTSEVLFRNSNDGGFTTIAAEASQYKLWSDTKIIVEVPSKAGTGKISVKTTNATDESNQSLQVNYAIINTGSNSIVHAPKQVARNANMGYIWNINENFHKDSIALSNLLISFKKWRCETYINWTIGSQTNINFSERDTVSVISFDERNELPAGVLGLCYSYYSGCTEDDWYIEEQDLLFKISDLWHFGDGLIPNNKYDFQSVALHELGHAHQLAHVINSADLMHFSIANGVQKRTIESSNLTAAQWLINKSLETDLCNKMKMKLLDNDLCNDEFFGFFNTVLYPNPFSDLFNIDFYLTQDTELKVSVLDISGKLLSYFENKSAQKGYFSLVFNSSIQKLSAGVYIVKIEIGNEKLIKKIIKQ